MNNTINVNDIINGIDLEIENKFSIEKVTHIVKCIFVYSFYHTIVFSKKYKGTNTKFKILECVFINDSEDKKIFIDILKKLVKIYEESQRKEKERYKSKQGNGKSVRLYKNNSLPILYELRHYLRSMYND